MSEDWRARALGFEAEVKVLRERADARSTFLATMSHEIREPMNGVLGMARLLRESPLDDEQGRFTDAIIDSGEALLTIINDILDLSKVDAGRLELVEMDVDVGQFFDRLAAILTPRAAAKELAFDVDVADDTPKVIRADPGRLRQILINLCSNSIKFTEEGGIRVAVSGDRAAQGKVGVKIAVMDTGSGIPLDLQDRLFSAYAQADANIPRLFGGSGLGLMIVERLVRAMGGTIQVESPPGQGTRFLLGLALDAPSRTDAARHQSVAISGSSALIIDGQARSRSDLDALLCSWSVASRAAPSIEMGRTLLSEAADRGQPFDVVLIDSDFKDQAALNLVSYVRQDSRLAGCSVVMMASSGLRGDAAKASAAGADAYVRKPLNSGRLLRCLQNLASWDRTRDGIMTVHAIEDREIPCLEVLVVDDNTLNCKLAEVLLTRAGHRVTSAANGEMALARLATENFDLVLMDIQMPVMNGFEATKAIRLLNDRSKADVPIIAITANAMQGDDQKCQDAGMNGYITKPINGPDLISVVERAVSGAEPEWVV